jgi:hypothetical protein
MREVFLQILKDTQQKLKGVDIKSQIRLSFQKRKLSNRQMKILPMMGVSTNDMPNDWKFGITGFWGTCLFVDVGLYFKIWSYSIDDADILTTANLNWRPAFSAYHLNEREYAVSIYQIDKVNNMRQKFEHHIIVSSWSKTDMTNPGWDPNIISQKIFDIIMKGKEYIDFCKQTGEFYFQYRPKKREER